MRYGVDADRRLIHSLPTAKLKCDALLDMFSNRHDSYNRAQFECIEKIFQHVVFYHVETFDMRFNNELNLRLSSGMSGYKLGPKLHGILGESRHERALVEEWAYSRSPHKKFRVDVYADGSVHFKDMPCCDCLLKYKLARGNMLYRNVFAKYLCSRFGSCRVGVPPCTPVVTYHRNTIFSMLKAPLDVMRDWVSPDVFDKVDKYLFGWDPVHMAAAMGIYHNERIADLQLRSQGRAAKLHGWGYTIEQMRKTTHCIRDITDFASVLGAYDGKIEDLVPTIVTILRSMDATRARRYYNAVSRSLPPVVEILIQRPQ